MKVLQKALVAVVASSLLSVGAQAAVYGSTGQAYVGAKVGKYIPNENGVDSSVSYGVAGGYKFDPNFGVEAEYLRTGKGDIELNGTKSAEYTGSSYGLYGTYDYAFDGSPLYAKGRLGIAKNNLDAKLVGNNTEVKFSDTGLAGGLGIGYNVAPNVSVEGMYNFYPKIKSDQPNVKDTDVRGLTLGANVKF